ncbi:glycoside hydrolase family 127 protein [Pseudonocardia xinjiangensis]|uniref:glycoside hydrolase family 127 protein n=1 Tax=Pseudonocardia xinjiangensis TaxID=75289 RepID=UPI003D8BB797
MTTTSPRTLGTARGPAHPTDTASVRLQPMGLGESRITGGFWAQRQRANGAAAIPLGRRRLDEAGNLENLRIAADVADGEVVGPIFADSDVYKWLEAAAWEYARNPSDGLLAVQREVTAVVAGAQADDGYLNSVVQVRHRDRGRYADLPWSHEHYCAGHLIQAAVAQVRCTGDTALLDVAVKLADHLADTFGEDRRHDVDGHPVIETALVELYRETGEVRHLELARYFVEARGHGLIAAHGQEPTYFSDRVPIREATTVEGHAVRAVYLAAGAADVAAELGDGELLGALRRQFDDMIATKSYVTGGLGSRWDRESFGDPYELPTDRAYAETCAAIGGVQWAWRMLLATGDSLYADAIERMLFNGFLGGISLAGTEFFYVNPLQLRGGAHADENRSPAHGRRGWFDCACCPPNVMRTLASLDGYVATRDARGVQLHQYAPGTVTSGDIELVVETEYPWDGLVRVRVVAAPGRFALSLRVPGWAGGATVTAGGTTQEVRPGYARLEQDWTPGDVVELRLPMDVRTTVAHPRVDAVRGCVAVERGPLVYAAEQADHTAPVDDLHIDPAAPAASEHRPDLLGGVTVVTTRGRTDADGELDLTLVPYYAWANRGAGPMRVWIPAI